jgi:hypothetical protein
VILGALSWFRQACRLNSCLDLGDAHTPLLRRTSLPCKCPASTNHDRQRPQAHDVPRQSKGNGSAATLSKLLSSADIQISIWLLSRSRDHVADLRSIVRDVILCVKLDSSEIDTVDPVNDDFRCVLRWKTLCDSKQSIGRRIRLLDVNNVPAQIEERNRCPLASHHSATMNRNDKKRQHRSPKAGDGHV